ncbi:MAG TPA: DnaJ domain-containing protein [Rhizomicrobium sp.]|jgi:hypothetical protein
MPEILIGAAVLIGILVLLRLFVAAQPASLVRALRYAGVGVLSIAAIALFYLRYVDLGLIVGGMAYGLYTKGHILPGGWPPAYGFRYRFTGSPYGASSRRRSRNSGAQSGQTSRVATAWIEIELDHDAGEMQGLVLQGKFTGKTLLSLSPDDLLSLYRESGGSDPETARLLEAYMDRRLGPDWRLKQQGQQQQKADGQGSTPRGRRDSGMSRDEALAVLGLKPGASDDEIRAAHKKLMLQNHPDRGGSDYLAAKINEAKDVLLG